MNHQDTKSFSAYSWCLGALVVPQKGVLYPMPQPIPAPTDAIARQVVDAAYRVHTTLVKSRAYVTTDSRLSITTLCCERCLVSPGA